MAKNNGTPVTYWAAMPLKSLVKWIAENNSIVAESQKKR